VNGGRDEGTAAVTIREYLGEDRVQIDVRLADV
jgi:hypothetical protein